MGRRRRLQRFTTSGTLILTPLLITLRSPRRAHDFSSNRIYRPSWPSSGTCGGEVYAQGPRLLVPLRPRRIGVHRDRQREPQPVLAPGDQAEALGQHIDRGLFPRTDAWKVGQDLQLWPVRRPRQLPNAVLRGFGRPETELGALFGGLGAPVAVDRPAGVRSSVSSLITAGHRGSPDCPIWHASVRGRLSRPLDGGEVATVLRSRNATTTGSPHECSVVSGRRLLISDVLVSPIAILH